MSDDPLSALRNDYGHADSWRQIETILTVLCHDFGYDTTALRSATRLLLSCYAALSGNPSRNDHDGIIKYLSDLPFVDGGWLDELDTAVTNAAIPDEQKAFLAGALSMAWHLIKTLEHRQYGRGYGPFYKGIPITAPRSGAPYYATANGEATHYVAKFARATLAAEQGAVTSYDELYRAYDEWCAKLDLLPLARADFDEAFCALCDQVGFRRAMHGSRAVCFDLVVAE